MSLPIKATSKSIRAFCSSPIKVSSFQSSLKFVPITFPAFPNSPPSYVLHIPSLSSESSVFSCENDAAKQSDHQYKQKIKCAHAKDAIPTNHPPSVSYTAYPLLCHIPVKHEYKRESYPTRHAYVYRNPAAAATPSKSLLQAPRLFYLGKIPPQTYIHSTQTITYLLSSHKSIFCKNSASSVTAPHHPAFRSLPQDSFQNKVRSAGSARPQSCTARLPRCTAADRPSRRCRSQCNPR